MGGGVRPKREGHESFDGDWGGGRRSNFSEINIKISQCFVELFYEGIRYTEA